MKQSRKKYISQDCLPIAKFQARAYARSVRRAPKLNDIPIRPDQAPIYRLSDDRNSLHCDPEFGVEPVFPSRILHGMCTYRLIYRAVSHRMLTMITRRSIVIASAFLPRFSRLRSSRSIFGRR